MNRFPHLLLHILDKLVIMVLMLVLVLLLLFGNIEVGVLAQQKHTGRRAVVRIEVGKLSAVRARRRSSAIIQLVVNGQSVDLLRCQHQAARDSAGSSLCCTCFRCCCCYCCCHLLDPAALLCCCPCHGCCGRPLVAIAFCFCCCLRLLLTLSLGLVLLLPVAAIDGRGSGLVLDLGSGCCC